jgi:GTP cyclohydrolase II
VFAYIDPSVRSRLVQAGKLVRIDAAGRALAPAGPEIAGGSTDGGSDAAEDADNAGDEDNPVLLNVLGPVPLPVQVGGQEIHFQWYPFVRHTELAKANEMADAMRGRGEPHLFSTLAGNMSVNSALVLGDIRSAEAPLIRVHSCCLTGDVFGSKRCECGPQLETAFERIHAAGCGAVIYMSGHEGRGIGLWAKAVTYVLQDAGEDTYEANRSLQLPDDCRDFSDAAALLLYLRGGDRPLRLMSNNPKKLADLSAGGLSHIESEKHVAGVNPFNRRYLDAKRGWGHTLAEGEIAGPRKNPSAADATAADATKTKDAAKTQDD